MSFHCPKSFPNLSAHPVDYGGATLRCLRVGNGLLNVNSHGKVDILLSHVPKHTRPLNCSNGDLRRWRLGNFPLLLLSSASALPKSPSRSRTALSFILFSPFAFLLLHKMEALRLFCRVLLLSLTGFLIRLSGLYEWKEIYEHKGEPEKEKNPFGTVEQRGGELFASTTSSFPPATLIQGLTTTTDAVCSSIRDVLILLFV